MYKDVPCIIICNSPKLKTAQMSIGTQMDEYIIQRNSLLNSMDELSYKDEWKKSNTKEYHSVTPL